MSAEPVHHFAPATRLSDPICRLMPPASMPDGSRISPGFMPTQPVRLCGPFKSI